MSGIARKAGLSHRYWKLPGLRVFILGKPTISDVGRCRSVTCVPGASESATVPIRPTLVTVNGQPMTTVGYWFFHGKNNRGPLEIQCLALGSKRFDMAVLGHELIEALWCKLRGITTEECDAFDEQCEREFAAGTRDPMIEPGFDHEHCPYYLGHGMGSWWERLYITVTLANWQEYDRACNRVMGIGCPNCGDEGHTTITKQHRCCRYCGTHWRTGVDRVLIHPVTQRPIVCPVCGHEGEPHSRKTHDGREKLLWCPKCKKGWKPELTQAP